METQSLPEDAVAMLLTCETFSDTHVGVAGQPSAEASAFAVVYRQRNAIDIFRKLLREAGRPGQLYALCGLYLMARDEFEAAIAGYRDSTEEVETMLGCIVMTRRIGELAKLIEDGEWPKWLDKFATEVARRSAT